MLFMMDMNYVRKHHCVFTELTTQFLVVVYNPLAFTSENLCRLPVSRDGFLIKQVNKRRSIPAQVCYAHSTGIKESSLSDPSLATKELIFPVSLTPPLGFFSVWSSNV
ncbi:hypothetical protein CEXT_761011 [Caerostris extrusa]|uniref:Uncharacterized protein n=1 Tax=Caerostris extrusa TaxID=172846 RepID=A0AAV4Q0D2_CAEEX|nr:hypothetical protein CEXT_761011 [Caerostris extrusa]